MDHAPRLVLDEACPGRRLALEPEDVQHLVKVLRLSTGALLEVLDGRGRAYSGSLELERRGAAVTVGPALRETPAPGTPGAKLPRVEVWAPWPKGNRAADSVGRLAQLGVAAWQPLVSAHTEAEARHDGEGRRDKLGRVAREALKQCGGLHALEVRPAMTLAEALQESDARAPDEGQSPLQPRPASPECGAKDRPDRHLSICNLVLDPNSPDWLSARLHGLAGLEAPGISPNCLRLWAGPEAGFAPTELAAMRDRGFALVRLSAHVLRIETALEASAAIVLEQAAARAER